jgi:hypothetical protein
MAYLAHIPEDGEAVADFPSLLMPDIRVDDIVLTHHQPVLIGRDNVTGRLESFQEKAMPPIVSFGTTSSAGALGAAGEYRQVHLQAREASTAILSGYTTTFWPG